MRSLHTELAGELMAEVPLDMDTRAMEERACMEMVIITRPTFLDGLLAMVRGLRIWCERLKNACIPVTAYTTRL